MQKKKRKETELGIKSEFKHPFLLFHLLLRDPKAFQGPYGISSPLINSGSTQRLFLVAQKTSQGSPNLMSLSSLSRLLPTFLCTELPQDARASHPVS